MTRQREFKQLVRARMAKTGERYTAARAQLLARAGAPEPVDALPGLIPGYDHFGGIQGDTAVLANVLRHAGITFPGTSRPYTEAMVNGLCGGPGFLYAVFEYKGWPPMLSLALRSRSMPDVYVAAGLAHAGVRFDQRETTSPKAARAALDGALAAGRAALCVVDIASLPWYGLPQEFAGGAPHVVAVAGRDGDDFWIDDRSTRPFRLAGDRLSGARARYRPGKHRLITIDGPDADRDAPRAICASIADTAQSYTMPAVPRGFWSNCGFAGIEKWRRMLTDRRDQKGWPTVFSEGGLAYAALHRAYECIEHQFTAPAGGRPFYADFLEEAAAALAEPTLQRAAAVYREAGAAWAEIAALIAGCGDPAVRQACEIADRRLELYDAHGTGTSKESSELWQKRHGLGPECRLARDAALSLYGEIAGLVGRIGEAEREAVALLEQAVERE